MTPLPKIMVAPNGARRTKADHPEIPVTIPETVAVARRCFEAGAGGIHAHVRNQQQLHILDAGLYRELIDELALQVPDMLVQITTEAVGRYSALQQRELIKDVMPAAVSVGLKEMISDGDLAAVRSAYFGADEAGIAVQHIVYAADELAHLFKLVEGGVIPQGPLQLLFVLGRYSKDQQSGPEMLDPFLKTLATQPQTHDWAICAFGVNETRCLEASIKSGGKVRVGFENSLFAADGTRAANNEERVREISELY